MYSAVSKRPSHSLDSQTKHNIQNPQTKTNSGWLDQLHKSTANSPDVPFWMTSTKRFYEQHKRCKKDKIKPHWAYADKEVVHNPNSQFQCVPPIKTRNKWQMKRHTFQLQWPQNKRIPFSPMLHLPMTPQMKLSQRQAQYQSSIIPSHRYSLRKSPLYRQAATLIKIGHSALIDSVSVK